MSYPERVAAKASEIEWGRAVLSILAFPFYALGFLVGLFLALVAFAWAAVAVGVSDARKDRVTDEPG